jgi:hypothetical protein
MQFTRIVRGFSGLLVPLLLILSASANVFLLVGLRRNYFVRGPLSAEAFEVLPNLRAKDPRGNDVVIDYGSSRVPTVLYVTSPTCSWSARNRPMIQSLAAQKAKDFRFIAISTGPNSSRAASNPEDLGFPIYGNVAQAAAVTYSLSSTPQTLVISPAGKLLRRWKGAYIGDQRVEIERYFGVKLRDSRTTG